MKEKTGLCTVYIVYILSLFMPWFTYNAEMMGYCWGTQFILYFGIPIVLMAFYIFGRREKMIFKLLAEIGAVFNIVLHVVFFATWQSFRNINSGFHWADGFRTAQPGFWLAFLLSCILFILLQYYVFSKKQTGHPQKDNPFPWS